MGLFGNDKIDGMFEKAKETLKDTTDKKRKPLRNPRSR